MVSNLSVHQAVDDSILLRKDGKEYEPEKRKTPKDKVRFRASPHTMGAAPTTHALVQAA